MKFPKVEFDPSGKHLIPLPAVLSIADILVTLLAQPRAFWNGDLSVAVDANPAVVIALNISPWLAIPAAIIWFGFICLMMTALSHLWRRRVYVFLCVAHLIFVWGWIIRWDGRLGTVFGFAALGIFILMHKQFLVDQRMESSSNASGVGG